MKLHHVCMSCALTVLLATSGRAGVVINEFNYDDTAPGNGNDLLEFVELYNTGPAAVNIGGWTVGGRDEVGATNPVATIPANTMIAPGGYYVIGNAAVPGVNQVVAANFIENSAETLELRSGAFPAATLMDAVLFESNKGVDAAGTDGYGPLPPDVAGDVGPVPGLWGNHVGQRITGTTLTNSLGRYQDGVDTNVNGRDFGTRPYTPGAANNTGVVTTYVLADVDGAGTGTQVPNFHGSFVAGPRVIDPTLADANNPNAIPASPQGGKAIISWDPSGGGQTAGSNNIIGVDGSFRLSFYLQKTIPSGADAEEWQIGIGTADYTSQNGSLNSSPNQSGAAGVFWFYRRSSAGVTLELVDFGAGGPDSGRVVLGSANLSDRNSGWYTLGLSFNGTTATGEFEGSFISGSTAAGQLGNFALGYREFFVSNANTRPITIDIALVPESSWIAVLGMTLVGATGAWGWRRKGNQAG